MVHDVGSSFPDPNGFTYVPGTCITLHLKGKLVVGCRGGSHSEEVCPPRRMKLSGQCQF